MDANCVSSGQAPPADNPVVTKYTVSVPDTTLVELTRRLNAAQMTDPLQDVQFQYGFNTLYLKEIIEYWTKTYIPAWRSKHERWLNSFDQYRTQIEGLNVHFLHVKPKVDPKKHAICYQIRNYYTRRPRRCERRRACRTPEHFNNRRKNNEVEKMILANRRITVREVSEDLNISIGSCHSIFINDLGMRRVAAKFVSKLLNCDQKQHRMNIANEMLESVRDDPNLLQRVITGDEAWVYGYDVETKAQSSQWKLSYEPRPKKARQVRSNVKVLLTVFFDCRGVVHHEFLPQGRTVNKEYHLQVMRNLREAIRQKRLDLWKNKNWLLHHDNAPAHTSLLVRDFLAKNNTLMMPQPPYSPDLAPCDFFLFPKLKRPMKGRRYATLDEIKTASKNGYILVIVKRHLKLHRMSFFSTKNQIFNFKVKVVPLMIIHGWPGSVVEFYNIIPLLTQPRPGHDFVFEVIAPHIPGYGFSDKPRVSVQIYVTVYYNSFCLCRYMLVLWSKPLKRRVCLGFSVKDAARVFNKLMDRLGHKKYFVQGGDWGSPISTIMAMVYPERVSGVHVNMALPPETPKAMLKIAVGKYVPWLSGFTETDVEKVPNILPMASFLLEETGYLHLQATKPDTVGVALGDSPAGLAAYLLEKFSTWTDRQNRKDIRGRLTEKFSSTSSCPTIPVKVPSAITSFPNELSYVPRAVLEEQWRDIVLFTAPKAGGHFGAMEEPTILADDLFSFARQVLARKA
ncbi:EPHX1 [Cordylochernes scorpioides]|uniref:EPHX1 n=1 Tax=Cordylochernes scorpioides TaxID=51811 RepID=A0ABY6K0E4_9ARAC|nr:EPHX1 [Cordylochernes scorpioides]